MSNMKEPSSMFGCLPAIFHYVSAPIFHVLSWVVAKGAACLLFLIHGVVSILGIGQLVTASRKPACTFLSRTMFSKKSFPAKPLSVSTMYRIRPKRASAVELMWFWTLILAGMIIAVTQIHQSNPQIFIAGLSMGGRVWDQVGVLVNQNKHRFNGFVPSIGSKPKPLLSVTQIRVHHHSVEKIKEEIIYARPDRMTESMYSFLVDNVLLAQQLITEASSRANIEFIHESILSFAAQRRTGTLYRSGNLNEPQSTTRKRSSKLLSDNAIAPNVGNGTFYSHWKNLAASRSKAAGSWKGKIQWLLERLNNHLLWAEALTEEGIQL